MNTVLTIAGSDSSGGAGIQADLKTMTANGVFGMSVITALTAQNTMGVTGVEVVSPSFLEAQLAAVFTDIFPDAVKIGMLGSADLMTVTAKSLVKYKARHIVLDPVMVATSGSRLMPEEALSALKEKLLPLCELMTPNIPEAEALFGQKICSASDMERAARALYREFGCSVLLKGGHCISDANDYWIGPDGDQWFEGKRIDNPNTHGTGCTLSSAIASNLAKGFTMTESVKRAKEYVSMALAAMLNLGQGSGPMNHAFDISGYFAQSAREAET